MINSTYTIIFIGSILFIFSIINSFESVNIHQSLQRSEVLASLSSVIILAIGLAFRQIQPKPQNKVEFDAKEGFYIADEIGSLLKEELAWGSKAILTATPAATILIYLNGRTVLKRGYITDNNFTPGKISINCIKRNKLVSLQNTGNYPGSHEFDSILENIPSILLSPLGEDGILIVGGWSTRCFSKSDETWVKCWSQKITRNITN